MLFAESLGCGPAVLLKSSQRVNIEHMILSGPEYLDFGVLNGLILKIMPQKQYKTARALSAAILRVTCTARERTLPCSRAALGRRRYRKTVCG